MASPSLDQVFKNHLKVARSAIRLKHSIAADNELAEVLPQIKARLEAQLQQGFIVGLSTAELLALVEGEE